MRQEELALEALHRAQSLRVVQTVPLVRQFREEKEQVASSLQNNRVAEV